MFEEILKPRHSKKETGSSLQVCDYHVTGHVIACLQVEIHVMLSPSAIKASILLNRLRLIAILDLLIELKQFVLDKLPEENGKRLLKYPELY